MWCLCLLLQLPAGVARGDQSVPNSIIEGLVVGVAEGDRITVNSFGTEIHVRLYGVAAPQTAKVDKFTGFYKAGQPFAEEAFRGLSTKVLHQQVKLEIRKTVLLKEDQKQIAVAVVYLDGRNINLEMIAEGLGWVYPRLLSRFDHAHYFAAQRNARIRRNGLWLQEHPLPPWEFKPQARVRVRPE
jgi:micrococcal nuclease